VNAIQAEGDASGNPIIRMIMPSWARSDQSHREALARLRLIRAAAGFLNKGSLAEMEDPLGTHLLQSQNSAKTRIWSVGRDGKDDGGLGGWPSSYAQWDWDIVFEIEK